MSETTALMRKAVWRLAKFRRIARAQSLLKIAFVLVFAAAFEGGLWLLFHDGFKFLEALGGAGVMIIERLFALFFLGMTLMMVASSVVTAYATIFRSEEVPFLMVRPFPLATILGYKCIQSTVLASWAFFFIIVPFIAAFAHHRGTGLAFALWTFCFSVPLLALTGAIGTSLVLLIVRWTPALRPVRRIAGLGAVAAVFLLWQLVHDTGQSAMQGFNAFNLSRIIPGLRLAASPLLPSYWVSEGIVSLAGGRWARGALLWALLASTAGVMWIVMDGLGRFVFYDAWQRSMGSRGRAQRAPLLMPWLRRATGLAAADVRAVIVKDIRTFLRDPAQWSQALIFFGLLAIYFANLRSFRYHVLPDTWRNTVAFLNVFSVAAVMCSLAARFIFPQLSLEGQGFWILGLAPTTTTRILLTKFLLSLTGMLVIGVGLMLLSVGMLKAALAVRTMATALAAAVACAVCGLSSGLGAVFIDLEQRNPAAIVSGFGGTLNLVCGLAFMLAAILPFAVLFHLRAVGALQASAARLWLLPAVGWLVLLTAAVTCLPLWIGARSLARREY